ncbi:MAG: response regulator [Gammaproteobacteria bacterium]|nr:response regulator [Gammaproteobacteria bacterium]
MTHHILIVDDEAGIREMLRMALEGAGYKVSDASSAHQADKMLEQESIDLIILDWMMPGVSGIEFARRLRKEGRLKQTGVIMVTAKDTEDDLLLGLKTGADDYVSKPFSTRALIGRVEAVLRRLQEGPTEGSVVSQGRITVNTEQHRVTIDGNNVDFSPTEFRLLSLFVSNLNRVYHRDQLLDQVWGQQTYVEDRTVDVHIRRLRKTLEQYNCDTYIRTVRGVGYQFIGEN